MYITGTSKTSEGESPALFRLADLTRIYKERLEQLRIESPNVHSKGLKYQLLAQIPYLSKNSST